MNKRGKWALICKRCGKRLDCHRLGQPCKDSFAIGHRDPAPKGKPRREAVQKGAAT